jgi:alpha-aminoadipic semialdehyde synthase
LLDFSLRFGYNQRIYWARILPKLITIPDSKVLIRSAQSHLPWVQTSLGSPTLPQRLIAICDISKSDFFFVLFLQFCTINELALFVADYAV